MPSSNAPTVAHFCDSCLNRRTPSVWRFNAFKLAKLQMCDGLTVWERSFVESLTRQGAKFSPRQQEVFDKLCAAHLKGGVTK